MTQECGRRVTPWQNLLSWFRSRPTPPQLCLYGSTWPHSSRESRGHRVQITAYPATAMSVWTTWPHSSRESRDHRGSGHGLPSHSYVSLDLRGLTHQENLGATVCRSRPIPPQPVCLELCDLTHQENLGATVCRSRPNPATAMSVWIYVASLIKRI
jgi:hypothetical protein